MGQQKNNRGIIAKARQRYKLPRHKDMTVCIAATYKLDEFNEGVAIATDWQLTDSRTGVKSDMGLKFEWISDRIAILGADDMDLFHDLCDRTRRKIRELGDKDDVRVEQVAQFYIEAEGEWKHEYLERHALTRFGLNWKSYFERLEANQLPQHFVEHIGETLKAHPIPYSTEAIIAGIDTDGPISSASIHKITPSYKDNRTERGYAVIGSGELVADTEFITSDYYRFWPKERTIFLCLIAKRSAELIEGVGNTKSLWLIEPGSPCDLIDDETEEQLDQEYEKLIRQRELNERRAYGRAEQILKNHAAKTRTGKGKGKSKRTSAAKSK